MEKAALIIAVIYIVFVGGYRLGYKHCFEYLMEAVKRQRENKGDL